MTRDSMVWWIGMIGAVVTALATQAGLFPATWKPYLDAAALIVGIVSGWMKTSPLPGAPATPGVDKTAVAPNVRNILPILVACALVAPIAGGCAKKAPVVKVDAGVYVVLGTIQDVELQLHQAVLPSEQPVISDALHGRFNAQMVRALSIGQHFNAVVRAWPVGTPRPAEVGAVALRLADVLRDLLAMLPASDQVAALRTYLTSAIGLLSPFMGA